MLEGIVPDPPPGGPLADDTHGVPADACEAAAEEKEETGGSPGLGESKEEVGSTMPRLPHIRLPDET